MTYSHEKMIIIGAGAAGLTAAIYAARANLSPVVLAGLQPGGQLTITTDVENYPGFADVIQGPWLMKEMQQQAENVGTRMIYDIATSVNTSLNPMQITTDSSGILKTDTIVVATGAQARWLGLESETAFNGRGVSACATCDGFFYKERDVVVIGGGNTAVEEALYLSKICKSVTLIHRRATLRAEQILQQRLFKQPNVSVEWNYNVTQILGDGLGVTGVCLKSTKDHSDKQIKTHGVFVAIGHDPATKPFENILDLDDEGYIQVKTGTTLTSKRGIFAAGDCVDKVYRQAVTAAGMGCMAALDAEKYLASIND